jgi:uncharacterized protein (TIGR02996 family)
VPDVVVQECIQVLTALLPRPDWANEQLLPVILCALIPALALLIASAIADPQRLHPHLGQATGNTGPIQRLGDGAGCREQHIDHAQSSSQGEEEWRAFVRAIADRPGDALPRLVFADWLDERGHSREAAGQRWAARHGKYAQRLPSGWLRWLIRSKPSASPCNLLPMFTRTALSRRWDFETAFDSEHVFLAACAQLDWQPDGEPDYPEETRMYLVVWCWSAIEYEYRHPDPFAGGGREAPVSAYAGWTLEEILAREG